MAANFKNIHIGRLIYQRMQECGVSVERAARFLKVQDEEVENISSRESADSAQLLAWSKLLEYDFFRIYSQHLILYAPQDVNKVKREKQKKKQKTSLPRFKKNIYTHEVILFLVELVQNGKKTALDIQKEYNIPSTTILRWVDKYGK
jgi:hypothetical protein